MPTLNLCPRCKGKASYRYKMPFSWVECRKCKCHTEIFEDSYEQQDGKQDSIDAWNNGEIFPKLEEVKEYIRFGEIPEDERSKRGNGIVGDGYEVAGKEEGVSVWNTVIIDNKYHLVAPHPTQYTYGDFCSGAFPDNCYGCDKSIKIYVVKGDEVGKGADNEPLLKNVKIVKELPYDYFKRVDECEE
jgi:hypothetical protein